MTHNERTTAPGTRVAMIGLGIMGSAMARNLRAAGFEVFGVDPDAHARQALAGELDHVLEKCTDLPAGLVHIVTSLPSSAALQQVCRDLAARPATSEATRIVVAETSTLPIADKLAAHQLLESAGHVLVDAPLSGTGAQARSRDLAVYASGDAAAIAQLASVFEGFARVRYDVGAFGNGMRMKLVANLLVAIHNVASAEALVFAQRLGLDPAQAVRVVGDGAGSSRMLQVRGPMMAMRSWESATMKVGIWDKDMSIIGEALAELRVPAPLFAACVPIYHAALAQGHALHDTASVYAVLEALAGGAESAAMSA